MDGSAEFSFSGIPPGETFVYHFPIHQNGTYWYHGHSAFQEQTGLYGALVIEPRAGYARPFERDYVVLLSDWSDEDPETIVSNLKFQSDYYNFGQRTAGTFFGDARRQGLAATVTDRLEWGRMRMSPTDILDVSGTTYLPAQRPGAGGELDGTVSAGRAHTAALHQRLGHEHFRCPHSRPRTLGGADRRK